MEVGCWAHARGEFHESRAGAPGRSHAAIARIGRLYAVGREGRDDAHPSAARSERSGSLLESFGAWLEGEAKRSLSGSPIGGAIAHTRSNRAALTRSLESPCLSIDDDAAEGAIRSIALGRKNGLHLGSDRGGPTAAKLLSPVRGRKDPGDGPFAYSRDVLDRLGAHPARRIEDLLPDRRVWPGPPPDPRG